MFAFFRGASKPQPHSVGLEPIPDFAAQGIKDLKVIREELRRGPSVTFHVGEERVTFTIPARLLSYYSRWFRERLPIMKSLDEPIGMLAHSPPAFSKALAWIQEGTLDLENEEAILFAEPNNVPDDETLRKVCALLCDIYYVAGDFELRDLSSLVVKKLRLIWHRSASLKRQTPMGPSTVIGVWRKTISESDLRVAVKEELKAAAIRKPVMKPADWQECWTACDGLQSLMMTAIYEKVQASWLQGFRELDAVQEVDGGSSLKRSRSTDDIGEDVEDDADKIEDAPSTRDHAMENVAHTDKTEIAPAPSDDTTENEADADDTKILSVTRDEPVQNEQDAGTRGHQDDNVSAIPYLSTIGDTVVNGMGDMAVELYQLCDYTFHTQTGQITEGQVHADTWQYDPTLGFVAIDDGSGEGNNTPRAATEWHNDNGENSNLDYAQDASGEGQIAGGRVGLDGAIVAETHHPSDSVEFARQQQPESDSSDPNYLDEDNSEDQHETFLDEVDYGDGYDDLLGEKYLRVSRVG